MCENCQELFAINRELCVDLVTMSTRLAKLRAERDVLQRSNIMCHRNLEAVGHELANARNRVGGSR